MSALKRICSMISWHPSTQCTSPSLKHFTKSNALRECHRFRFPWQDLGDDRSSELPRSQETGKVQDKLFAGCWREGLESQLRLKCNLHNNELLFRLEALFVGYFSFRDIICGILLIPQ